jgi:hypothetical protein
MSDEKNTECDSDTSYLVTITNNAPDDVVQYDNAVNSHEHINSLYNARDIVITIDNNLSVTIDNDKYSPVIPQNAQKCAWCNKNLYYYDDVDVYNGALYRYNGWLCHKRCNL